MKLSGKGRTKSKTGEAPTDVEVGEHVLHLMACIHQIGALSIQAIEYGEKAAEALAGRGAAKEASGIGILIGSAGSISAIASHTMGVVASGFENMVAEDKARENDASSH